MRVALLVLLAVLPATVLAGPRRCGDDVDGAAVPCACGDVLVSGRTLGPADPITQAPCDGDGLLVRIPGDRPGETLGLGAHTIAGTGRGVAIRVQEASGLVIAGPGTVRGFDRGVVAPRGVARLTDLLVVDNRTDGIQAAGPAAITRCESLRNGRDGVALAGTGWTADGNRSRHNGRRGILASGRGGALGTVSGNEVTENGDDGILLRGRRHRLDATTARGNGGAGVRLRAAESRATRTVLEANGGPGLHVAAHDTAVDAADGGATVRGARTRVTPCTGDTCP